MTLLIFWYHFKEVLLWHGNASFSVTAYNILFENVESTFLLKLTQTMKLWVWCSQHFFITKIFCIPVHSVNWADMPGLFKNDSRTEGAAAWRGCNAGSRAEWQRTGPRVACPRSLSPSPKLQRNRKAKKKRRRRKRRKRKEHGGEGGRAAGRTGLMPDDPTPCSVMWYHSVEVTLFSFKRMASTG